MVGGDGGGPQLVDVATVVHVDGLGLIGVKSNNGLQEGNTDIENYRRHTFIIQLQILENENHDLANARSSSSRADPGLRVAFKYLNI